jgi:hypothetical protein
MEPVAGGQGGASLALIAVQPFLLGLAVLLDRWTSDATDLDVLVRPVVVVVLATAGLVLIGRLARLGWPILALIADVIVLFTLRELVLALLFAAVTIAIVALKVIRPGSPSHTSRVRWASARVTAIFAVAFLAFTGVRAGLAAASGTPAMARPTYTASSDGPNVYVLLLDGYPRADTLADAFNIDNAPFLEALTDRGFDVSENARTNYNKTWLTLASMLNGAYVSDLLVDEPELPDDAIAQLRWLHAMIERSAIPDALRHAGYAIRTIPSAYGSTALSSADEVFDSGEPNEFEVQLIASSPWTIVFREPVVGWLLEMQARRVEEALAETAALAASNRLPHQFVLSHIHSPHTPFVLGSEPQERLREASCFPAGCTFWEPRLDRLGISGDQYREGLTRQIATLNGLVTDAIDRVVASDPDAVVIVLSDHGMRFATEAVDEHYRSFLAARTPGHPQLFADDEFPANVLRKVMTAYFGADLEPLPYHAWTLEWTDNLHLEPYSPAAGAGTIRPMSGRGDRM